VVHLANAITDFVDNAPTQSSVVNNISEKKSGKNFAAFNFYVKIQRTFGLTCTYPIRLGLVTTAKGN
jgi:hypothetical protein